MMKRLVEFIANNEHIQIVKRLKGKRSVYLVGGTIRDLLLGKPVKDYDFAVSGSGISCARTMARKMKGAFVLLSKKDDEARVVKDEIVYDFGGIGKRPIAHDLKRRDFTVNAMAIDLDSRQFLDPSNGLKDLKKKTIRPVTADSLRADSLRVLRGFRFSLELDFRLSKDFFEWAKKISLKRIAAERIGYELMRIMAAPQSFKKIVRMNDLGLFQDIFPEAKKIIEDAYLWGHSLSTYEAVEVLMQKSFFTDIEPEFSRYFSYPRRTPLLKLAALFHDIAKPDTFLLKDNEVHFYGHDTRGAKMIEILGLKRLKLSRDDVTMIKKLVKEHMRPHLLATNAELTDRAIRRFFRDLGEDWLGAMMIAWADGYATAGRTQHLEHAFTRMIALRREDEAKPKIARLVNGYDLIALGLQPGPKFKIILQELFDLQLEGKITNKEEGLDIALEIDKKLSATKT